MLKLALKFIAETIVRDTLSSAGMQIGEAIGKKIGAKIHPPDEAPTEEEDAKTP